MKKLVVALAGAVLFAAAFAAYSWLELRSGYEQGEELASRIAALEAQQVARPFVPPAPPPLSPAPAEAAAPAQVTTIPAAVPAPPAPRQEATGAGPASAPMADMVAQLMQGDQGRDLMRAMMAQMYPDLATELDLTPEEMRQFVDLMAQQQQDLGLESMGLMAGGPQDPAARQELQGKLVEKERAHEAELAALLGSKYPRWEEYQHTAAARQQVQQLRSALVSSDSPLTEAQSTRLVTAFAAEQKRLAQDERNFTNSAAALASPDMMQETMQRAVESQRRLVDVAAPHLSSAQLERFRRQVEQQVTVLNATMGLMGGQGGQP